MVNLILLGTGQVLTWAFLVVGIDNLSFQEFLESKILFLVFGTLLVAAGGYLINDYHDIKIDLINKPESVIIGNRISKKATLILYWLLTLSGIIFGALASLKVGLVNIAAANLLWFYSTALKRLPYWGNIAVSFLAMLSILVLLIPFGWHQDLLYWYAAITFSVMILREVIKDLEDMPGDEKENYRTIPLAYGLEYTKNLLYFLGVMIIFELISFSIYLDAIGIWILFGCIAALVLYLLILLRKADTKKEFSKLSLMSKLILTAGILSILWVGK
jgi:4-hydroxybenzoate polyprenyltransferase